MDTLYLEHLETVRNLIVAGWMLLALGWAVQLGFDAREDAAKGKQPKSFWAKDHRGRYELCKLHQRPTHECRDMHSKDEP